MGPSSGGAPALSAGLRRLLNRLWVDGAITVGRRALPGHRLVDAFVAVPDVTRPRFLIPRARRRTMASTLTCYVALRPPATRVLRRTLAGAALAGAVGPVLGDVVGVWIPDDRAAVRHAFTAHLRAELHAPDAVAAMGTPRIDAHYKPTAQLFSASGDPLGFAKLGWTAPTATLVRRETEALRSWHEGTVRHRLVHAPAVLLSGTWDGLPYVVTRPLPSGAAGVDDRNPLPEVARDIAGDLREAPLGESSYWSSVRRRLSAAPPAPGGELVPALRRAVSVIEDVAGRRAWRFGRWHGDWASWNVARTAGTIHVWDWEHSTTCAPWGFDLLHWQVTVPHLRHGVAYRASVAAASRSAHLPGIGVPPPVLLLAYLVEMGLRSVELRGSWFDEARGGPARPEVDLDESVSRSDQDLYAGLAQALSGLATAVRAGGAT